jgi:hypothetical protein
MAGCLILYVTFKEKQDPLADAEAARSLKRQNAAPDKKALESRTFQLDFLSNGSSGDMFDAARQMAAFDATNRILNREGDELRQQTRTLKAILAKGMQPLPGYEQRLGEEILANLSTEEKSALGLHGQGSDANRKAYRHFSDLAETPGKAGYEDMVDSAARHTFESLGGSVENPTRTVSLMRGLAGRKRDLDKEALEKEGETAKAAREQQTSERNAANQKRIQEAGSAIISWAKTAHNQVVEEYSQELRRESNTTENLTVGNLGLRQEVRAFRNLSPAEKNAFDLLHRIRVEAVQETKQELQKGVTDRGLSTDFERETGKAQAKLERIKDAQRDIQVAHNPHGIKYGRVKDVLEAEMTRRESLPNPDLQFVKTAREVLGGLGLNKQS